MDKKTPYYEVIKNRFCTLVESERSGLLKLLDNPAHLNKMINYLEEIKLMQSPKPKKHNDR